MNEFKSDYLIIGGGIVGLSIARELKRRNKKSHVTLIEKEADCGMHASSRNSGVLHAGFYYTADSLKARFTQEGNQALTAYCKNKKIKLRSCGKLVVAKDKSELPQLEELFSRGKKNRVPLEMISSAEAKNKEPRVKTYQHALFSPTTSSVNPLHVVMAMKSDAIAEGIQIHTNTQYLKYEGGVIRTSKGDFKAGFVINSAGLYADKIAKDFGLSQEYKILPFKGLYLYCGKSQQHLKMHVYPVPNLDNPFLGVHFTITAEGKVKIGPTAIPALWREQYGGWERFNFGEMSEILMRQVGLMCFSNFNFKRLAYEEIQKYNQSHMVELAKSLVSGIKKDELYEWGKPGIRAQLVHTPTRRLEMDFVIQKNKNSLHILNAVSPGFTCAIPFAKHVCDSLRN